MKKTLYLIWALALIFMLSVTGFFVLQNKTNIFIPKKVHIHAGFVIFEHNKKRDFSDASHMNMQPCTNNDQQPTPEEIQMQKAHLHDRIGDVVHVEREGATWQDLITNLHISTDIANITGYINGQKVDNFQNRRINPYDNIVIFIGENDSQLLNQTVAREQILEAEKMSDGCAK